MSNANGYLLLVEDEPAVQADNMKILQEHGYNVKQAYSLTQAKSFIKKQQPRGIILDISLPDGCGLEFITEFREKSHAPILILTARNSTEDIIRGFELGSDDYLTKPYDLSVFLIRVNALLRRAAVIPDTLELGKLKLFPASAIATLNGDDMMLSQKEYSILQLLVQNIDKILSPEFIYEKVWRQETREGDNSLKVAIAKLRKKLKKSEYTVAVSRGEGYYLEKV